MLRYTKFRTLIDVSFWLALEDIKIRQGLDDSAIPLSFCPSSEGVVALTAQSFALDLPFKGALLNYNTLSEFKAVDRKSIIKEYVEYDLVMICYADIKKHKFIYQVAYPCRLYKDTLPQLISVSSLEKSPALPEGLQHIQQDTSLTIRDYSNVDQTPGWLLRRVLTSIQQSLTEPTTMLINCLRPQASYQLNVQLDPISNEQNIDVVGYEHLKPEAVDISRLVDPLIISKQAITLNLELMKWRLAPSLDLEAVAQSKVLILGVGTLGCNVIRVLLGWNVTNLSIVDNGKVSYSNLCRQPLYKFDDYGKSKVLAAKQNLMAINPHMSIDCHDLTIPAPGHSNASDKESLIKLQLLIEQSDVVFLLTDSRETRYFPTMMCLKASKLCINAALGFDSYLLMRQFPGFGCYYCSDVVGPRDSMTMRTLDEQCTVTRPGLAAQCAAQAVEMFVQLVQHPLKFKAPHSAKAVHSQVENFGQVPHIIRYYQRYFQPQLLSSEPFAQCCACSAQVQDQLDISFMLRLLDQPSLIDIISGLEQIKLDSEDVDIDWQSEPDEVGVTE